MKELLQNEQNFKIHILLGNLYLLKNNTSLANIHFTKAKELNNQAPSVYHCLFKINILKREYGLAKHNLEKFIKLDNSDNMNVELYKLLIDKINR